MYKFLVSIIYNWASIAVKVFKNFMTGTAVNKHAAITSLLLFLTPTKCVSVFRQLLNYSYLSFE